MRPLYIVLLLLLVAAPHIPGLFHGFVYDDHGSIVENPFLTAPGHLQKLLTLRTLSDRFVPDGRRPTVIASYLVDLALWGPWPLGFHLTNLLLHLLNTWLVLNLLQRLCVDRPAPFLAFGATLLFGLHPAGLEAIQVPAFREDLLAATFALLCLRLAVADGRTRWLAVPALLLALLSKESALVVPLILGWMWWCFPNLRPTHAPTRTGLLSVSLGLSALFALLWVRGGSLQGWTPEWAGYAIQFPHNLSTALWLWLKALKTLAWPWPLIADHIITPVRFLSVRCIAGGTVALATFLAALILRPRVPPLAFGLGWMLIAFLPVSNILPLYNPFAERYLYFLLVGFALALARLIAWIPDRPDPGADGCGSGKPDRQLHLRALLLSVFAIAYSGLTVARLADWKDDFTLWTKTVAQEPRSSRAHTWLGLDAKHRGDPLGAYRYFAEADRLNPQDVSALINIAILYGEDRRFDDAATLLREAVRRRPDKPDAHWNLAVALMSLGRPKDAREEVDKTLELDPMYPGAQEARGWLLTASGERCP